MSSQRALDLLFAVQIAGALLFCGAHFFRSLVDVHGASIAQAGLVAAYLASHIVLSQAAHRARPSRVTRQVLAVYWTWLVLIAVVMGAIWTNSSYRWSIQDSTTLLTAAAITVLVLGVAWGGSLPFSDPLVKALFAIAYKSVPQVLLAWKIWVEGGSGIPGISVLVGHLTILVRLGQIYFMVKEAGFDRNRRWLAVSEGANEVSWMVATAAWLMR